MPSKYVFDRKNVIVTGGAGFLGSHLCDELVKDHKVICIDNLLSGQESNIHHLYKNPNFEFIKHDVSRPLELRALPDLQKFEVAFQGIQEIYHLASPTAPADYLHHPIATMQASATGTQVALDWARQFGASFLYVSSAAVYGMPPYPDKPYVKESYWGFVNSLGELAPFQEGKRFAETLTTQYRLQYSVPAKIVRLFNTYGPRMRWNDSRVIPSVVRQAITGGDIDVQGDPQRLLSACFARDAVQGMIQVMAAKNVDVVNLGNPEKHTFSGVVEKIMRLAGSTGHVNYQPPLPHDQPETLPDISKIRDRIGWLPLVGLEHGLQEMIAHMRASRVVGFADEVTI